MDRLAAFSSISMAQKSTSSSSFPLPLFKSISKRREEGMREGIKAGREKEDEAKNEDVY